MVKKQIMLRDFPAWPSKGNYGYINALYRNNRNRKQIINTLNRDAILINDIPIQQFLTCASFTISF